MENSYYKSILMNMKNQGASDLYLCPDSYPLFRIKGEFHPSDGSTLLNAEEVNDFIFDTMTDIEKSAFLEKRELDYSLSIDNSNFFRINAYFSNGKPEMVVRAVESRSPTFDSLRLPDNVKWIAENVNSGIVIVSGATGSGKSSTLAAIINHINNTQQKKIITIEDPIEIRHCSIKSSVSQREVGSDTLSFKNALKSVLRQRPDVILLGEIRDAETMKVAINASESGHLVLATLHAGSAPEVVNRVLNFYPIAEQPQVRYLLSSVLKAVIAQRLAVDVRGKTLPLVEVMTNTLRIRDAIADESKQHTIRDIIIASEYDHMQEFDACIYYLYQAGVLSLEESLLRASRKDELLRRIKYQ